MTLTNLIILIIIALIALTGVLAIIKNFICAIIDNYFNSKAAMKITVYAYKKGGNDIDIKKLQ